MSMHSTFRLVAGHGVIAVVDPKTGRTLHRLRCLQDPQDVLDDPEARAEIEALVETWSDCPPVKTAEPALIG